MLDLEDTGRQACLVVIGMGRHDRLCNDRSGVDHGANEVHGAPGESHTCGKRLSLRVESRKSRQQGRMNVDNSITPRLYEGRVENAHEPGQADQIDPPVAEQSADFRGESTPSATRDDDARNSCRSRKRESRRLAPIADNQDYFGGVGGISAGVKQRSQVRSAAREKYTHPQPRHLLLRRDGSHSRPGRSVARAVDGVLAKTIV